MPRKTPDQWFDEYGESHQNRVNKLVHWVCVPAIAGSIIGLLWSIPTPSLVEQLPLVNWATLVIVLILIFYIVLSIPLALGMLLCTSAVIGLIMLYEQQVAESFALWKASVVIFVLAWIGQFIGHQVEGKKPSFFQDLQFLLIGPLWLLGFIYRRLGINY